MSEADENTGVNFKHISLCCNNKRKTAGGYKWKFKKQKILKLENKL